MERKSLMDSLKPRKGHGIRVPCHFKMKAFKFLLGAYEIDDYDELDFTEESFKRECKHDFGEDKDDAFER